MADKNPTELLNRLIAENPDADDEKLFRLFSMQCGEHWEEIARHLPTVLAVEVFEPARA